MAFVELVGRPIVDPEALDADYEAAQEVDTVDTEAEAVEETTAEAEAVEEAQEVEAKDAATEDQQK
jgi:hypothetical protein